MIAAFFDMDKTLLRCNSGERWVKWLRRRGEISTWTALRAAGWILQYKLSVLDMERVSALSVADMRGEPEQEMLDKTRAWFEEEIRAEIAPLAVEAVERHRRAGHLLVIVTSSTRYISEPVAAAFGIEHVLCTRLHVDAGGRFLGTHERPSCYGEGKVHWAERFAVEREVDLGGSFFYTDSYTDLPMLLRVGQRRVVNPDARLKRHARRAGWEIEAW